MENGASWFSRNSRGRFTTSWWSLFYNNESLQRRSRDLWRTSHICSPTTWTSRCSCPAVSIPRASSLLRSGRTTRRAFVCTSESKSHYFMVLYHQGHDHAFWEVCWLCSSVQMSIYWPFTILSNQIATHATGWQQTGDGPHKMSFLRL